MSLDQNTPWYSEIHDPHGAAFSLRIKAKLHEEQTPFQTIAIYDTETYGKLMTIDGLTMVTDRDNFIYHEMMSHPVLFTHPNPKRVLIIGGGDCGTLREVLRHPGVEAAHQVEIDERVTRLAEQYFPELCEANDDPRAKLLFEDGIKWVKDAEPGSYDVIIIDSTDPVGPAEGLFGESFYRDAIKALGRNGLLVQQSESPLYHLQLMKDVHAALRRSGFADVKSLHFPQPIYPSGWWSCTMACKDAPIYGFRERDARAKAFPTRYYNADLHRGAAALPTFMQEAFDAIR